MRKGHSAVKIDGGRGSRRLSLQCKDREFPRNFDVVPKVTQELVEKCYWGHDLTEKWVQGNLRKNFIKRDIRPHYFFTYPKLHTYFRLLKYFLHSISKKLKFHIFSEIALRYFFGGGGGLCWTFQTLVWWIYSGRWKSTISDVFLYFLDWDP